MQEPKRKVSFKIWSLLIISLLFIGSGIFLKRQYNSVIWAIKDEVIASIPEGERSGDFTYTNQSGRTVTKYILKKYLDNEVSTISNDIYGDKWETIHISYAKWSIIIGIVLLITFVYLFLSAVESPEFSKLFLKPGAIFLIGIFLFCAILSWEMNGFYVFVFVSMGFYFMFSAGSLLNKRLHIYDLQKNDLQAYLKLVEEELEKQRQKEEEERIIYEAEKNAAINGNPDNPWEKKYLPYPCPYCNRYKVRYMKWEDKRASVMFWGAHSMKIGKHYICDNCKKTWE